MTGLKLGFFVSHGGSNMQAVIDACKSGRLNAVPRLVICNNSNVFALERAINEGIPFVHLSERTLESPELLDQVTLAKLREAEVNLVLLLGYMKKLGPATIAYYRGRLLNIHPALLPRYGGKSMFGINVHKAVIAARDKQTGVTIHLVDELYDHGDIVAQCRLPVRPSDTPETLAARVLEREHSFLVETLERIEKGNVELPRTIEAL